MYYYYNRFSAGVFYLCLIFFIFSKEARLKRYKKAKDTIFLSCLSFTRRRLTLPGPCGPSTISTGELNFCVRYGNRCDLSVIVTRSSNCDNLRITSSDFSFAMLTYLYTLRLLTFIFLVLLASDNSYVEDVFAPSKLHNIFLYPFVLINTSALGVCVCYLHYHHIELLKEA